MLLHALCIGLSVLGTIQLTSSSKTLPIQTEMSAEVRFVTLRGDEAKPYQSELSDFYSAFFAQPPYRYHASKEDWDRYVGSYVEEPSSLFVLAVQNGTIIAAAMGTSLERASEKYRAGFAKQGEEVGSLFYLGELAVAEGYRNYGIGTRIYTQFEAAVRQDPCFSAICLWQLASESDGPSGAFWKKRGFTLDPELHFEELWRESFNKSEPKLPHEMMGWKKTL